MYINEAQIKNVVKEVSAGRALKIKGNEDGSKSWIFCKKMRGFKSPIRKTIGYWPDTSLDEAESIARIYRKQVDSGIHPNIFDQEQEELRLQRKREADAKAMTLRQLVVHYDRVKEIYGTSNALRTIQDRRRGIYSVFAEWLDRPILAINKDVVLDKIEEWGSQVGSRGQVLKVCRYMSALYNFAKDEDVIEKNPFDILRKRINTRTKEVKHYLQPNECRTLLWWIEILQDPETNADLVKKAFGGEEYRATLRVQRQLQFDAIALTLLTGLRKLEVLSLRWEQVYLTKKEWGSSKGAYFEILKSKQQEPFGVPITEHMLPYFERCLARRDTIKNNKPYRSPFVFPSIRTDKSVTNTRTGFAQLNTAMPDLLKAPEIGAQVLRKTFATTAYNLNYPMEEIDKLTGHTSALKNRRVATDAYIAHEADSLREGFETINRVIVHGDADLIELEEMPDKRAVLDGRSGKHPKGKLIADKSNGEVIYYWEKDGIKTPL